MRYKISGLFLMLSCLLLSTAIAFSASQKPATMAELALYKGQDRQQILEEGARKEGKLTFYTTGLMKQAIRPIVDTFQKTYPFIKVEIWGANLATMIARLNEEAKAGVKVCDVVEGSQLVQMFLQEAHMAQPFYSPNIVQMQEEALTEAPDGGYYTVAFRGSGISLGYNTTLIREKDVPKTYEDLLDPKWKGKISLTGSTGGANWMSAPLHVHGEEFVKKIARQNFNIHVESGGALLDMIISGEYALSPTIYDSHVLASKQKGAPVEWLPLEPVPTVLGGIAMPKSAPHPYAALLFVDFEMTKKSAELHKQAGYSNFHREVPALKSYKKYFGPKTMKEASLEVELFNKLFVKQ